MRQAVMTGPGKIEFRDVPEPSIGPREILLRLKNIGICGSDIHVWHGTHPFTKYPVVQGHEYSAVIEAVGEKIKTAKLGMRATARPQLICGDCGPCRRGDYHVCQNLRVQGFQAPGCAQDLFVVPEERLVLFPESMSYERGAMIEPASVGAHSSRRADGFQGKNVVISGAGTIGNIVAQFVQVKGAAKVLITDISDFRLEIAKTCGIQYTANVTTEPLEDVIKRVFGDDGFQVGFEAAGVQASIESLIGSIEKGGEIIVLGVYENNPRINMGFIVEHEIRLTGSMMYSHEDYVEAVEFISKGRVAIDPLITKHFPFRDYNDAYKFIENQGDKTLKVVIDM